MIKTATPLEWLEWSIHHTASFGLRQEPETELYYRDALRYLDAVAAYIRELEERVTDDQG